MKSLPWMVGALVSFCLMAVGARELNGEISIYQTLFFRSLLGLFCISLIMIVKKTVYLARIDRPGLHIVRNTFHFAGQYGWFVGIGLLPLAEVFALEFTVPIWTAIIAALFLNETITPRKTISIALGIAGVCIIVKPGFALIDTASLIVLAAAVCYSVSHVATKSLSSTNQPITILFYMCLIQLPMGLYLSLPVWKQPNLLQSAWLVVISGTALTAHFCLVKAMKYAEVTTIVTMDFLRLPAIGLVGILLYNEAFELSLILGATVMLLGNLINAVKISSVAKKA